MLDVILYRIDSFGRIDLSERAFEMLQQLSKFFASKAGGVWHWAEIDGPCRCKSARYTAEQLRAMAVDGRAGPFSSLEFTPGFREAPG